MATLPKDPTRRDVLKALAVAPAMLSAASPFAPPQTPSAPVAPKLQVGIVSRHLQWTSVEDAIDLAKTGGFDAIEWTSARERTCHQSASSTISRVSSN